MRESRSPIVERTGVVVIRIWIEDAGLRNFRARVSLVRDIESGETATVFAAGPKELLGVVRRFVDDFATRAELGGDARVTPRPETPRR
jgi:hypothetical protein